MALYKCPACGSTLFEILMATQHKIQKREGVLQVPRIMTVEEIMCLKCKKITWRKDLKPRLRMTPRLRGKIKVDPGQM